jgi:ABC-type sugar transport system ATPase subunit
VGNSSKQNIIEMTGITKRFPGVLALDDVDFNVENGQVHGLVGENGAGKTTLLKVLAGLYKHDKGTIVVDTEKIDSLDVGSAINRGIRLLAQNPEIYPSLSVAENIFMEDLPLKGGMLDSRRLYASASDALLRIDLKIDPRVNMETLSFLQQKIVLLAKALWFDVKILILDEPTAALTSHEKELLFKYIKELNKQGTTIIYVSHYLEEVFEICDVVTVLREGKKIVTESVKDLDINGLVRYMIGKDVHLFPTKKHDTKGNVLEVSNLSMKGKLNDVSFSVKKGEIISLAGIKGSGKEDVVDAIFGFENYQSGEIKIDGKEIGKASTDNIFKKGTLLLPADRLNFGLFLSNTVNYNISICSLFKIKNRVGLISEGLESKLSNEFVNIFKIKTSSLKQEVQFLSGGNQQKVVLAKVLAADPKVLVLHEPTAGIDIGSKAEIHNIIENLAREGIGIILLTYDIPEVINMSDRVYVFYKGSIYEEIDLNKQTIDKNELILMMEGSFNESKRVG